MPATVLAFLEEARRARTAGSGPGCLDAMAAAQEAAATLDQEHPIIQVLAWKRSKAEHDFGTPSGMLDALDPILDQDDPFVHYPASLNAVERLTRHYTDRVGYGDARVTRLWEQWIAAQRRARDPFLAEMGAMNLTWIRACTGALGELRSELDRVSALSRRDFARSPSQHIEAKEVSNSVFFVQMEVSRAVLTGAMWTGEERLGWEAWQLYEDAIEEVDRDRSADFWYLSTVARAGDRFAWSEAATTLVPLRQQLSKRARDVHTALVEGDLDRKTELLLWAAEQAIATHAGFEWAIDALLAADRIESGHRERAMALAAEHDVGVFQPSK